MAFEEGHKKIGGRVKGDLNLITRTVRETFLEVFNTIQSEPVVNLKAFAIKYPREFYLLASKLIPTEIVAKVEASIVWNETKQYVKIEDIKPIKTEIDTNS